MTSSVLHNLPNAELLRDEDDGKYLVSRSGDPNSFILDKEDILCFLPGEQSAQGYGGYTLLYVASNSSEPNGTSKVNDLVLYKVNISRYPKELPGLELKSNSTSFFGDFKNSPDSVELSVVVSVKSGACQAEEFYHRILKDLLLTLDISDDKHKVYFTDSERWIADFALMTLCKKANKGVAQSVILLSGDGGIVDIINGILAQPQTPTYVKPKIGLLAFGTGNALANSSKLNTGKTHGLQAVLHGQPRSIPTFLCKCSPGSVLLINEGTDAEKMSTDSEGNSIVHGAVVASWCLHATLVGDSDTTEYRKFGSERFSMAANELLAPSDGSPPHKWQGKVTIYCRSHSGEIGSEVLSRREHMYILATLVSNLEASLKISPKSAPLDGQLRLVEFPPLPAVEIKQIFGMAFDGGKHIEHQQVGYKEIEGLRIDFEETDPHWRRICVDGKIIRVPEGGWVELERETREVVDLMIGS